MDGLQVLVFYSAVLLGSASESLQVGKCTHPFQQYNGGSFTSIHNIHIPKAAGVSFILDTKKFASFSVAVVSHENCFEEMAQAGTYATAMFRHPRGHVYSMYLQNRASKKCHINLPHQGKSQERGFAEWVEHFHKGLSDDGSMNETRSFGCYHAYNLQSRAFSPLCTQRNNANVRRSKLHGSHFYSPVIQNVDTMNNHLADNMYKLNWLGLSEFYTASLCILQDLVGVPPFETCDPGNYYRGKLQRQRRQAQPKPKASSKRERRKPSKASQPSHADHGSSPHSHLSVPDEIWEKVDDLTYFDRKLYYLAMRRFACGVKAYEQQANHSLEHLLPAGGWEYLYDISDAFVKNLA
eukprot:gene14188-15978_t